MAVPARPLAGALLDAAWGQVAHDAIVAQDLQVGVVSGTISAALFHDVLATFPRPFAAPPKVLVSLFTNVTNCYAVVATTDATGAVVKVVARAGTAITQAYSVNWLAYGPRA
jgi:hypothetical protein